MRTQHDNLRDIEKDLRKENSLLRSEVAAHKNRHESLEEEVATLEIENNTLRSLNAEHREAFQADIMSLSTQNADLTTLLRRSNVFRSSAISCVIPGDPRPHEDADILRKLDHLVQIGRLALELLQLEMGYNEHSHADLLTKKQQTIETYQQNAKDLIVAAREDSVLPTLGYDEGNHDAVRNQRDLDVNTSQPSPRQVSIAEHISANDIEQSLPNPPASQQNKRKRSETEGTRNSVEILDGWPSIETDEPAGLVKRKPGRPKGSFKEQTQSTAQNAQGLGPTTIQPPSSPISRPHTRTTTSATTIPAPSEALAALTALTRRKTVDTKPLRKSWVARVDSGLVMPRAQILELEDEVELVMDTCDSRVNTGTTIADWTTPGKPQCIMTRTNPERIHRLDAYHTHDELHDVEHNFACVRCSDAGYLCIEIRGDGVPTVLPLHPFRCPGVVNATELAYWCK